MDEVSAKSKQQSDLRRQAEEILQGKTEHLKELSTQDIQSVIHELRMHQIELEMQNEELRRAQKELEESRREYTDLYDFAPIGYFTFDKKGLILKVNLTGANMLGKGRGLLIKYPFSVHVAAGSVDAFFTHLERVFKTGARQTCELKLVGKNQNQFDARLESTAVQDSEGNYTQCRTAMVDITERKRMEDALYRAKEELEERVSERTAELARSNTELEQFAYVASHDLQEPLRMITGFAQLLERRYKGRLDKDADEFIAFIVDGAKRMQRMIEDLLEYSRVGTRGKPFEPTNLENVFNQAVTNLKVTIEESKAVITRSPLPTAMADATQMVQLFQNLIGNAIKFRKKGEPPHIHISARKKGNEWLFSAQDNGIGIAPEFMNHLFQLFQREHPAGEYPGTGIGLALCKRIVERHGGRMWAQSEVGKGSTFYFTMPVRKGRD